MKKKDVKYSSNHEAILKMLLLYPVGIEECSLIFFNWGQTICFSGRGGGELSSYKYVSDQHSSKF